MKSANRWLVAMLGGVILLGATCAFGQDWPQWRGPNRDGKVAGFTAPAEWPKELVQKWKVSVGAGDATPALVGDKLYVFSRVGDEEVIQCLSVADGKEVWKDKYAAQAVTGAPARHPGPRSSPTVADGKVVTLGVGGVVSCLDAAKGTLVWRKEPLGKTWPKFFTSMSPLVMDGLVIVQLGSEDQGAVMALDLATGDTKWKWDAEGTGYASPAVMKVGDVKSIVTLTSKSAVGLNAADGKLLWKVAFAPSGMNYNAATPIIDGTTAIITGSGRGTKALSIEKTADGFAAKELWTSDKASVQFNTPILKDGIIYGLTANSFLFCISAKDGKPAWTQSLSAAAAPAASGETKGGETKSEGGMSKGGGMGKGGRGGGGGMGGGGGGFAAILDAGTVLIAMPNSTDMIVFKPTDKEYSEVAKIKVAETPVYATPVISGARIFIKDQDSVILWTLK